MILLDTHIWILWVSDISKLSKKVLNIIKKKVEDGICISIISIWEVTKLIEKRRIEFKVSLSEWIEEALRYPGLKVINLDKEIILHSAKLKNFHKDPADQLIVSTSIIKNIPLLTYDKRILDYEFLEPIKF